MQILTSELFVENVAKVVQDFHVQVEIIQEISNNIMHHTTLFTANQIQRGLEGGAFVFPVEQKSIE